MSQVTTSLPDDRPMKPAILRGLRRRCPNCGQGSLFSGYLKTADSCAHCGQVISHHRADDGPAYLTILIVAHLVGFAFHFVFTHYRPEPVTMAVTFSVASITLALFLLPRLKGMVVAIQWAKRMHGFGREN